jgi:hypothetical protein
MRYCILILLLMGCEPDPALKCDYCHVVRKGAQRYVCDKCKMPHSACDVDRAVMHYEEGGLTIRGRVSYSATGLLVCPSPEDPATESKEPAVLPTAYKISTGDLIFDIFLGALAFFIGYAKGWTSKKNRDKKFGKDLGEA